MTAGLRGAVAEARDCVQRAHNHPPAAHDQCGRALAVLCYAPVWDALQAVQRVPAMPVMQRDELWELHKAAGRLWSEAAALAPDMARQYQQQNQRPVTPPPQPPPPLPQQPRQQQQAAATSRSAGPPPPGPRPGGAFALLAPPSLASTSDASREASEGSGGDASSGEEDDRSSSGDGAFQRVLRAVQEEEIELLEVLLDTGNWSQQQWGTLLRHAVMGEGQPAVETLQSLVGHYPWGDWTQAMWGDNPAEGEVRAQALWHGRQPPCLP